VAATIGRFRLVHDASKMIDRHLPLPNVDECAAPVEQFVAGGQPA